MKYILLLPTICVALVIGAGLGSLMFLATMYGALNGFLTELWRMK